MKDPGDGGNRPGAWPNLRERSDMADGTCTVPDCGRVEPLRRKMCRKHYLRWKAHGTTDDPQPKTHCPQAHEYTPENTYIDPAGRRQCRTCRGAAKRASYARTEKKPCSIDGCGRPHLARGWCGRHYDRWRRTGSTDDPTPTPATCTEPGCDEPYVGCGYCRRHYNLAYMRDWRKKNPEYFKERARAWRAANSALAIERVKEYRRRNPEWARKYRRMAVAKRRARIAGATVEPVNYEAIIAEHGMVCHICGSSIDDRSDLHMDHVIPLSRGGRHAADNIRPSHSRCNLRKGSKLWPTSA